MPWLWAALMPHPPILVPEVGGGREREAAGSLAGARALLARLAALGEDGRPDAILLLSPHQPYAPGSLLLNTAPRLRGGLGRFGAPQVAFDLATPAEALEGLADHLNRAGLPVTGAEVPDLTPDHGSQVPLYFLSQVYDPLPPVVVASPIGLAPEKAWALGRALAKLDDGRRWALLASGDLSHCLKPEGPNGYHPAGAEFDRDAVLALKSGDAAALVRRWPQDRLPKAAECGCRSLLALLGLVGGPAEVFSYEGPFGVGYCYALGRPGQAPAAPSPHPYPALARATLRLHLAGQEVPAGLPAQIAGDPALWAPAKGCFVSIKTLAGELRGCIGTIQPAYGDLGAEIMGNAVSAATRDPRFAPMSAGELAGVAISVDVLNEPEPVSSLDELNPARWGVIVEKGGRRGLLLPDLEGVDTVQDQLAIAARKAGLNDLRDLAVWRFSVSRYPEEGGAR